MSEVAIQGTLREYLSAALKGRQILALLTQVWDSPSGSEPESQVRELPVRIEPNAVLEIEFEGSWVKAKSIEVVLAVKMTNVRLQLKPAQIGPHQIAHAEVPNILADRVSSSASHLVVNVVRSNEGVDKISAIAPSTGGAKSEVIHFTMNRAKKDDLP